jgi:hypothetical protein
MRPRTLSLTTLLALAACGGGGAERGASSPADTSAAVAAENSNAPTDAAAVIQATLTGGRDAGSANATAREGACSRDTTARDVWSVQYRDTTASSGLSGVRVVIPGVAAALRGTSAFYASLVYGRFDVGNSYVIETRPAERPGRGAGTARVDTAGRGARITVRGTTADGVGVELVVQCNRVGG